MRSLNETVADIAGREIGDRAFEMLGSTPERTSSAGLQNPEDKKGEGDDTFNFDKEMGKTRLRVDALLADGKIEEAERYMEERRKIVVENGFLVRKLNQAYFAFHGTYAESAVSISPISDQLHRLRALMPDVGAFISAMSGVSGYQEFLEKLKRLEAEAGVQGFMMNVPRGFALEPELMGR